jgi:hypothetical protein
MLSLGILKYLTPRHSDALHHRIVEPRLNFELFCDWFKMGHVV